MRKMVLASMVLMIPALAFGQTGVRSVPGYCANNCGPYIPLVTTPMVSLQTASPSAVGASNATGGLQAGARNSTLQMMTGDPNAVYTQPVWVSGGTSPLVSSSVHLPHAAPMMGMHDEHMMHMQHGHGEEANVAWTYYAGRAQTASPVEAAASAKSGRRAAHTYTNQDVERMNQQNKDFQRK
jgi:hypothetical protein